MTGDSGGQFSVIGIQLPCAAMKASVQVETSLVVLLHVYRARNLLHLMAPARQSSFQCLLRASERDAGGCGYVARLAFLPLRMIEYS